MTVARGIRNKNPGNIEASGWTQRQPGYMGKEPEGRFAVFDSFINGIAAQYRLLLIYRGRGLTTLRKIINTWAPPEDNNDVSAYLKHVSDLTGFGYDQELSDEPRTYHLVAWAMACHECGPDQIAQHVGDWPFIQALAAVFPDAAEVVEAAPPPPVPPPPAPTPEPAPIVDISPAPREAAMNPLLITGLLQAAASAVREIGELLLDKSSPPKVRNMKAAATALEKIAEVTRPENVPPAQWNEQKAVEAVLANPETASKARDAILTDYDRLLGIIARGQQLDEDSRDRAAARAKTETWDMLPFLADKAFKLLAAAVIAMVGLAIVAVIYKVEHGIIPMLATLIVATFTKLVDRWGQLYDYRIGSSAGSKASGDAVRAIAERK